MEMSVILPALRQVIAYLLGALAAKGLIDGSYVEPLIAVIIGGGNLGWLWMVQRRKNAVIKTAVTNAVEQKNTTDEDLAKTILKQGGKVLLEKL